MTLTRILLIGVLLSLFIGIASATDSESDTSELVDTVDTIDDAMDALDIAVEGNELLNKQLEDPTNATLVAENIEKITKKTLEPITGDLDNFDPQEFGDRMIGITVASAALYIFLGVILPALMALVAFIAAHI